LFVSRAKSNGEMRTYGPMCVLPYKDLM